MPCYYPLKAELLGMLPNGKKNLKVISKGKLDKQKEYIDLPCGKCIHCRLEYSRMWAVRSQLEAKQSKDNYFVTLTYSDENLRFNHIENNVTGEVVWAELASLYPRHFTLFMKRLRKSYGKGVRFYACGEYGDRSMRPHYHLNLFNCPLDDLKIYSKSGDYYLYSSKKLDKLWGLGNVIVAEASWETYAYTARYVMKKKMGRADERKSHYGSLGLLPEFVRMSRKPGIGSQYYDDNKHKIYDLDEIVLRRAGGGVASFKPPKYFDNKYDKEASEHLAIIKSKRIQYMELSKSELRKAIGKDMSVYVKELEAAHQNKIKALKRNKL